jgi:hypothetical protein
MDASDLVPSSKRLIRQGDVSFNRVNSESVQYKIAGGVNFLLERTFVNVNFSFNGVVMPGIASNANQVLRIQRASTLINYNVFLLQTGTINTDIVVNFNVFDSSGTLKGTIFGDSGANRVLITGNGSNIQRLTFGRDLQAGTNYTVNQGAATRQLGEVAINTFEAGDVIIPIIVSGSRSALNLDFELRISED